ncbi:MAG: putative integrase [Devosia sp.]|jgi:integrase|nr:putative integrase [Devosia sp.]
MANIRNRNGRWQAQVRRQGSDTLTKTFPTRKEALAWARAQEHKIDDGRALVRPKATNVTLGDLLDRYRSNVTPTKKSAEVEGYRIGKMLRHPLSALPATKVTTNDIVRYRDDRLADVSSETVRQDLVLLRQVFDVARREWGHSIICNPVDNVTKPPSAKPRTRRLTYSDLRALAEALATTRNPVVRQVFRFALATGMRRGEVLRAQWQHVDWQNSLLLIPVTKTDQPRLIPLTPVAMRILDRARVENRPGDKVFPITANAFRLAWQRVKARSGVVNFRFHDLRHEAVSGFFEQGLSLPEVALISGHRDPRQLMRYTHLDAARIAKKLRESK